MTNTTLIRIGKILTAVAILSIAAIFYYKFNPELVKLFPPCLFKSITGYKCPGCGTQRALHYLLHFDVWNAFLKNPMMVIALPYLIVGLVYEYTPLKYRYPNLRKVLFGRIAIYISFVVVVVYWITRNIFDF